MVKAGIFSNRRRFTQALADTNSMVFNCELQALATFLVDAYRCSCSNTNLKRPLANSTISPLWADYVFIGYGDRSCGRRRLFHIINHAIFKASFYGGGIY